MTQFSINDPVSLRGEVTVVGKRKNETSYVSLLDEPNLIVLHGRNLLAKFLSGDSNPVKLASIAFGTNGSTINPTDSGVRTPLQQNGQNIVFNFGQTGLSLSRVDGTTPKLICTLTLPDVVDSNDPRYVLEGKTFKELALMLEDGSAFACKSFTSGITKSSDISIIISWVIYF